MTAFISAIIGIIFGAWINNILLWKIKQKIEYLDILLRDLLDCNSKFLEFIRLKCPVEDPNISPTQNDYIEFGKHSGSYVNNALFSNYIIYGSPEECKDTAIYKSLVEYYDFIAKKLNDKDIDGLRKNFYSPKNDPLTPVATEYQNKMSDCRNAILNYRNNLTLLNLRFWLQELVCKNNCNL